MNITIEQIEFLETLIQNGIHISAPHSSLGYFEIEPNDIQLYIDDKDQFAANQLGVSKTQFTEWQEFAGSWQCLGTTKSGNRCKSMANFGFKVEAKDFGWENENCYCSLHKSQALKTA